MPTKAAMVAIGIDRTGYPLPKLAAAAQGAEDMAEWARKQGIDVECLTDAKSPRTLAEIQQAVRVFVDKGIYGQLIVYFSGHGLLRAPGAEVWLLSGAPDTPSEAVNVIGSTWNARNCGIAHVVFISDACRTLPPDLRFSQVVGSEIFPSLNPRTPRPEVDSFYATLPGDPALEAKADDIVPSSRGVFTDCLLKALRGDVDKVIEAHGGEQDRWVVRSRALKTWLLKAVPEEAARIDIKLVQNPDVQVESDAPAYLSTVMPKALPRSGARAGQPPQPRPIAAIARQYGQDTEFMRQLGALGRLQKPRVADAITPQIAQLKAARGRPQFETHTGFTFIGAPIADVRVSAGACDVLRDDPAGVHVRIRPPSRLGWPAHLLAKFADGNGAGLAILPGYVGTVLVEDGRVLNVNYTPSQNTDAYADYAPFVEEIEARKAFAAAAARNGLFRIGEDVPNPLQFLQVGRVLDYTLALYTAYAYAQTGNLARIRDIHALLARETGPVPFDIALLAGQLDHSAVTPVWPLLSQGWTLPSAHDLAGALDAGEARKHLVPGLWTTFTPEGLALLWTASKIGATTEESA